MIGNIKVFLLFVLAISCLSPIEACAKRLVFKYQKPQVQRHLELYHSLRRIHKTGLGESVKFLNGLYDFERKITIVMTECGFNNSRFSPVDGIIYLCYETLLTKVEDYPSLARDGEAYDHRVFQNIMFTLYHEVGHVMIDQRLDSVEMDPVRIENLADEFAILNMLWRGEKKWKDLAVISALHFKNKAIRYPSKKYERHPSDQYRYEKMIALIYGMSPKSYARLREEVESIPWLTDNSQVFYLDRSQYWEGILRSSLKRNYF